MTLGVIRTLVVSAMLIGIQREAAFSQPSEPGPYKAEACQLIIHSLVVTGPHGEAILPRTLEDESVRLREKWDWDGHLAVMALRALRDQVNTSPVSRASLLQLLKRLDGINEYDSFALLEALLRDRDAGRPSALIRNLNVLRALKKERLGFVELEAPEGSLFHPRSYERGTPGRSNSSGPQDDVDADGAWGLVLRAFETSIR